MRRALGAVTIVRVSKTALTRTMKEPSNACLASRHCSLIETAVNAKMCCLLWDFSSGNDTWESENNETSEKLKFAA